MWWKTRKPVSDAQLQLATRYAQLVEGIGIEKISYGADESLLPAPKDELRGVLAAIYNDSRARRVLMPDDLRKLYGILDLFMAPRDLEAVQRALSILEQSGGRDPESEEERRICEQGVHILQRAAEESATADSKLRQHAASL